jgi:hypothetical protein
VFYQVYVKDEYPMLISFSNIRESSTTDVMSMSHGMATGGLLAQHTYLIKELSYCVLTFSLADLAESPKM